MSQSGMWSYSKLNGSLNFNNRSQDNPSSSLWNNTNFLNKRYTRLFTLSDLALPIKAQVVLVTLYTSTILLSIFGNLIVLVVFGVRKRPKSEMGIFIINLAIADLLMACFCMPFSFTRTMLGRWIFGQIMCPLVLFMQVTSVAVSIFTNMAIGIDR